MIMRKIFLFKSSTNIPTVSILMKWVFFIAWYFFTSLIYLLNGWWVIENISASWILQFSSMFCFSKQFIKFCLLLRTISLFSSDYVELFLKFSVHNFWKLFWNLVLEVYCCFSWQCKMNNCIMQCHFYSNITTNKINLS